jgi:uncharacterized protein (TIGR02646 family)
MIRVERDLICPGPLDLKNEDSIAARELQAAEKYVAESNENFPEKFFKAYSNLAVRERLKVIFSGKCGYCESAIAASQDCDVDHYRPKGQVMEANGTHRGYWWLAMVWSNLVASCQHCNQRRKHIVIEPGMTKEEVADRINRWQTRTLGKLNSFPTKNNKWVSQPDGDIESEVPLLIDPTRVDPDQHLVWLLNEPFACLAPKNDSQIGKTSIDTYALNRRWLVEDRTRHLRKLRRLGNRIISKLNKATSEANDAVAAEMLNSVLEQIEDLKMECGADKPYAALARAYLKEMTTTIRNVR